MNNSTIEDSDPEFKRSEEIKAEYLSSGCQAVDVDEAVNKLMVECGSLFESDRHAWSFLMEEAHEELEESVDAIIERATLEQQKLALQSLLNGLADLGFGTDQEIDGADAVEAMGELFDDVLHRVLKSPSQVDAHADRPRG